MKQSALFDLLPGARTSGEYHGWITPRSFGDTESEFRSARTGNAITDHSMFGRIEVTGSDRIDLLHRLSTNSLTGLASGGVVPTVFVTDKGRVVDAAVVCAREDSLVLITSPGAEPHLMQWIDKYTITEDIRFRVITDETIMVSFIGAQAISILSLAPSDIVTSNTARQVAFGEGHPFVVRRSDRRSDIAFMIAENASAGRIAGRISALAEKSGARWIGSDAYEGFRIGAGIPSSPGEINGAHNPLECGLRDSVSFTKGCYIGQEVIARLDTYGKLRRHLAGLSFEALPAEPPPLPLVRGEMAAGELTSVSGVPFGGKYPALGIIRNDVAGRGDSMETGGSGVTGIVTELYSDAG